MSDRNLRLAAHDYFSKIDMRLPSVRDNQPDGLLLFALYLYAFVSAVFFL